MSKRNRFYRKSTIASNGETIQPNLPIARPWAKEHSGEANEGVQGTEDIVLGGIGEKNGPKCGYGH